MADYEDPGWGRAIRGALWIFIPFVGEIVARRSRTGDALTQTRRSFLALVAGLFFFFVAFAFVEPWDGGDEGWIPIAVLVLGLVCLAGVAYLNRRPLRTEDPNHLAGSFRASFFIGVGMAESAALFGICGIFISGSLWIYLVEIQGLSSPLSLGHALLDCTPPRRN